MSSQPTASTSSLAPPLDPSLNGGTKRKRLPACDSCKLRRLKCDPVPPPGSCPRCKQTGVVCTTTPVARKKAAARTGKRIEEAKATFGTADALTPEFMGPSNTPWVGRTKDGATTLATGIKQPEVGEDTESDLAVQQINGAIVAHLLELYQAIPQSWLPIGVRGRVLLQFEAAGRKLEALGPQTEVLARVTIALTSRLSSHPALFASGSSNSSPIPSFESLTPEYLASHRDLREFGRRREAACEEVRRRAVELAWKRGTLVETSEEAMASCYLLEMLEGRNNPIAGKPYGSAFVSHLQTILNGQDQPGATMKVQNTSLAWSALIMREALYAANAGRTSHFTATDDLLLCGEVPVSIEEALMETVDDVDVRDSITLFFRPMRPYTYHAARMARECSEQLTGTFARRRPFNERALTKYLTELDHLLHLFAVLEARIAFVLSPAATAAHSLPAPFEQERRFIMSACLYTLSLAWSSLSLPVYTELTRRIDELLLPPPDALPAHAVNERKRLLERLQLLKQQLHSTVLKGARMVAQTVHEAPSLAFLTHLQSERLGDWCRILVEAVPVEEGGEGITAEERESDLRWMLDGLKTMGWSWTDDGPLITSLENALGDLSVGDDQQQRQHEQESLDLPTPAPLFSLDSPFSAQPAMGTTSPFPGPSQALPPSAQPAEMPLPAFFDPPASAAPPPPSASSFLPNLSTLSSLFGGVPAPSSAPPPIPTTSSSSDPQPPPKIPDLSTLISLYSSGALNPIIEANNLNVAQLAGQYLMGTLDLGKMMRQLGIDSLDELVLGGAGGAVTPAGAGEDAFEAGEGTDGGGGFDLEALLAEPLFGAEEGGTAGV
ncbi:hypothetical protein JCM8547_005406 [Rhodosporidiobolus lusitaniae]